MTYDINQHPRIKEILAFILTAMIGALLIFSCESCSTSKSVEKTSLVDVSQDSTYHHTKDSVIVSTSDNSTDSLVQNTVVYITLDSLGNETKRIEYHDTYHSKLRDRDNSKSSVKTDTLYKTKYKMVEKIIYKNVIKEATFSLFQRFLINTGKVALVVGIIALLVLAYKKRNVLHVFLSNS